MLPSGGRSFGGADGGGGFTRTAAQQGTGGLQTPDWAQENVSTCSG